MKLLFALIMKAALAGHLLFVPGGAAPPFSPTDLSGLQVWFDGADSSSGSMTLSGSNITVWKDKSANAFTTTPTAGMGVLTAAAQNGQSTVQFDGSTYYTFNTQNLFDGSSGYTILYIGRPDNTSPGAIICNLTTGPQLRMEHAFDIGDGGILAGTVGVEIGATTSIATGNYYRVLNTYNGSGTGTIGNYTVVVNGTNQTPLINFGTGNFVDDSTLGALHIGGSAVWKLTGYIGEIIVYNRLLNGTEIGQLNAYALAKWGI